MQTQGYSNPQTEGGEALAKAMREGGEELDRITDTAYQTMNRVKDRASELSERMAGESDRLYAATRTWIAAHPMQALAGALAVGVLLGMLSRTRD